MPENCQYIYWKICDLKKAVTRSQVEEIAMKSMSKIDYYEAWSILLDMGVLVESDGIAKPHYFSDDENGQQEL